MINNESFEIASIRINSAIKDYENEISQRVNREKEERNARLEEILKRKKKKSNIHASNHLHRHTSHR
jgi:hypothetical protein